MNGRFARLAWNSLSNYAGNLVTLAVGFVLTPLLVHVLGDAGYGAWILVGSIGSYFWLLDFGMGSSVTKFVSEFHATRDRERLNLVVSSSCALLAVGGVLSIIGGLLLAQWADLLFRIPADIVADVRAMIVITAVSLGLAFPLGVFSGVLRGYQRYDLLNLCTAIATLANALGSVLVLRLGWGLVGLSVVGLMTSLLSGLLSMWFTHRIDPLLVLKPGRAAIATLRHIASFSVWVFVINIAVQVVYRTSPIIIGSLLGVAFVTPFAVTFSLTQYVRRFVDPILSVLLPAYAGLNAGDEQEALREMFTEGSKIVSVVSLPLLLGLLLLGRPFIGLWLGSGYQWSADLLYILVPTTYLSFLVGTGDKLLWARGKVRVNALVAIADIVLNLGLSVLLVMTQGVSGAAWAMFISVGVTNGLWLLPYICRVAGVPLRSYVRSVVWQGVLPAIPTAVIVLVVGEFLPATSYVRLGLLAVLCVGSYWALYLSGGSGRQEWKRWTLLIRGSRVARAEIQVA